MTTATTWPHPRPWTTKLATNCCVIALRHYTRPLAENHGTPSHASLANWKTTTPSIHQSTIVSYIFIIRQCRTPMPIFAELRLETYTDSIDPATSVCLVTSRYPDGPVYVPSEFYLSLGFCSTVEYRCLIKVRLLEVIVCRPRYNSLHRGTECPT